MLGRRMQPSWAWTGDCFQSPKWPEAAADQESTSRPLVTSTTSPGRAFLVRMDFNNLKDQVSNLTLYDIKAGVRKVQNGEFPGPPPCHPSQGALGAMRNGC